jgi:hypothetical protein
MAQTSIPSVQVDCRSYIGDERTSMNSLCSGLSQYYGGVHAPNEPPTSRHRLRSLIELHDSRLVPTSAYFSRFCPGSDEVYQPGHWWTKRS